MHSAQPPQPSQLHFVDQIFEFKAQWSLHVLDSDGVGEGGGEGTGAEHSVQSPQPSQLHLKARSPSRRRTISLTSARYTRYRKNPLDTKVTTLVTSLSRLSLPRRRAHARHTSKTRVMMEQIHILIRVIAWIAKTTLLQFASLG